MPRRSLIPRVRSILPADHWCLGVRLLKCDCDEITPLEGGHLWIPLFDVQHRSLYAAV